MVVVACCASTTMATPPVVPHQIRLLGFAEEACAQLRPHLVVHAVLTCLAAPAGTTPSIAIDDNFTLPLGRADDVGLEAAVAVMWANSLLRPLSGSAPGQGAPTSMPFVEVVQPASKNGQRRRCWGVAIDKRLVLTPRHCFRPTTRLLWRERSRTQLCEAEVVAPTIVPKRAKAKNWSNDLLLLVTGSDVAEVASLRTSLLLPGTPLHSPRHPDDAFAFGGCASPACMQYTSLQAPFRKGDSGTPVYDDDGRLVGMGLNGAKRLRFQSRSQVGFLSRHVIAYARSQTMDATLQQATKARQVASPLRCVQGRQRRTTP